MRAVQVLAWALVVIALLWPLLHRRPAARRRQSGPPDELVKDPMCQTYVVRSRAVSRSSAPGIYFCSADCARRYLAETHG
jgi:YHS domain-containing protein